MLKGITGSGTLPLDDVKEGESCVQSGTCTMMYSWFIDLAGLSRT